MPTLLEHLLATGEERVRMIWQQAQAEVHDHQEKGESALAEERRHCQLREQQDLDCFTAALRRAAEEASWQRQSEVEIHLADRLFSLASNQLPWLREHSGKGLFSTLAAELPSVRWSVVRIHKDDIDLARAAFPEAQVEGDSGITGGLIAQSEDGSMQVINTLEKRLERAWPQLLPELFRLVRKEWENAS